MGQEGGAAARTHNPMATLKSSAKRFCAPTKSVAACAAYTSFGVARSTVSDWLK